MPLEITPISRRVLRRDVRVSSNEGEEEVEDEEGMAGRSGPSRDIDGFRLRSATDDDDDQEVDVEEDTTRRRRMSMSRGGMQKK